MDNNNQNRNGGKRPSGQNIGVLALILVITLIAVTVMNNMVRKNQTQELGYEEFVEYLKEGEIDTAKISNNRIYLTPKTSSTKLSRFIQYYTVRIPDVDLAERLLDANGVHVVKIDTLSCLLYGRLIHWEQKKRLRQKGEAVCLGDSAITEYKFTENYYFVSGDNMENSKDSRYWGMLPESYIVGRAFTIWRSDDPLRGKIRWNRVFKRIK